MSGEERRRKILLTLLAIAAGILLWRQLGPYVSSLGASSSRGNVRAPMSRSGAASTLPEVVDLRLEDLEKEPGQFSSERDPFRFGVEKQPAPPPVTDTESAMRKAMREARYQEQQEAKPRTPAAPKPPPVDVEYLGSFGPRDRKLAVFSNGTEIFNVFEGDRLNENFYLVKIGLESADIGFV
ncbi:MAG: hypothetical protein P8Y44_07010, partial [Acidobacteriota bacterium]